MGVSFVRSPANGYRRGGSEGGRNILEAELIASEVIKFARLHPEKSLGVAAFSVTQRDAIRDLVDDLRRKNPETESFFSENRNEHFFIKNLESIQGDERDVIFISVGYGRTEDGRLTQTFGPLAADGGERRLNVLISRAKERCTVFSSITSEDVKAVPGKRGINAFKEFLQFAEKGYFDVPTDTGKSFDSDFEESVAIFLEKNGYRIEPQVGMVGFSIDLGVIDPSDDTRFLCGIECDGASYHSSRSARDRDRLRQEILENRGWKIYRIWSTDWFHRRQDQEQRLLEIGRAHV
jgi:very-short-patch-repair endonuclease